MMNTVCVGGSSMSFSILLAQVWFMRSGNHTMQTLYPPIEDFNEILRFSSSLSAS